MPDFITNLTLADLGKALVAGVPLLVALIGLTRGPGAQRSRLAHDVELLEKLPENSEARTKYEAYLATQVERFTTYETSASRDVQGAVIAGAIVLSLGVLALWLVGLDRWWWQLAAAGVALFALAGLQNMYEALERVPRDDDRKRL